jgi:CelD/BcsL family acetyltransferase involved in cellulose biosynthesis
MEIEEVDDVAGLAWIEADWRAVFDASETVTPFQSWEWISAWWRHCGGGRPWVLVARENGRAVGLLPLVVTRYRGTPLRQVRFLGAPLSDYQDVICAGPDASRLVPRFFAHLAARCERWDLADLNDLRAGGPVPEAGSDGLRRELGFHRFCPVIRLEPTWEAYAKRLNKSVRTNALNRRRKLERELGAVLEAATAETLDADLEALFRLHNTRWRRRGAMGAFSDPRVQAFHRDVARDFLARGWLRLYLLRAGGVTRGALYCFSHNRRVYDYLGGFEPELSRYSPGVVLLQHAIAEAIKEGVTAFDLLRGDEGYKYAWRAEDTSTVRLVLGHDGLRSRLAVRAHRLERTLEREGLKLQRKLWGRMWTERATQRRKAQESTP